MERIECKTKKWGSSIGIIIPNEVVKKEHIKPDELIQITINKQTTAKDLWEMGPLVRKQTTQEIKDELRKGW